MDDKQETPSVANLFVVRKRTWEFLSTVNRFSKSENCYGLLKSRSRSQGFPGIGITDCDLK